MIEDHEITESQILDTLINIGGEGTGHEIFQRMNITSSYYKELIRNKLIKMADRGILIRVPVSSLNRATTVGNRGSVKWAYRVRH